MAANIVQGRLWLPLILLVINSKQNLKTTKKNIIRPKKKLKLTENKNNIENLKAHITI